MTALIVGATGFLGRVFMREGLRSQSCDGTARRPIPGYQRFDLTASDAIGGILDAHLPDAVIITAALADVDACAKQPDISAAINRDGPAKIAVETARRDIPIVFISTDYVFDGQCGPYAEDSATAPSIVYGQHKAEAEAQILQENPRAVILRTSQVYDGPEPLGGFLAQLVAMLLSGRPAFASDRMLCTPTFAPDIVSLAGQCLELGLTGVFHAAGPQTMTRYEAAQRALSALGHAHDFVRSDTTIRHNRPERCGLSIDQTVNSTSWHPKTLETALAKT